MQNRRSLIGDHAFEEIEIKEQKSTEFEKQKKAVFKEMNKLRHCHESKL